MYGCSDSFGRARGFGRVDGSMVWTRTFEAKKGQGDEVMGYGVGYEWEFGEFLGA